MPHGGGHHGGGHHGGGHHGGGGWGGGHHHHGGGGGWGHHHHNHGGWGRHHHHGRRWGGGWGWGWGWGPYGYPGYYRYQRTRFYRGWGFCIGMFLAITLIIVLSISLSIRYNEYDSNADKAFAPGDTRILSYSSSFCDGLRLSGDYPASLYLLDSIPPLSGPTNYLPAKFERDNPDDAYKYLYYYLHAGSKVNMRYCLEAAGGTLSFAFIKGKSNFRKWKDDGDGLHTVRNFPVTNTCSPGPARTFPYSITSGDTYYFVYDNTGTNSVNLNATLELNRTEYLPEQVRVRDLCTLNDRWSCSVSVPYNSDYVALLQVNSSTSFPEDNFYYSWSCNSRAWVYVLIVLLPLLFMLVVTIVLLVVCVVYIRKRSQKYANLPTAVGETPAEPDTVVTTTVTTATALPLANPAYNPPPDYGSVSGDQPPPYPTVDGAKK